MCLAQAMFCAATIPCVYNKKGGEQRQRHQSAYPPLTGEFYLLLGYLGILLLCLIDGGQLCSITCFLLREGRIEMFNNICCYGQCRVATTGLVVRLKLVNT